MYMYKCSIPFTLLQDTYPTRIKGINFYKAPAIFEVVLRIMMLFLKDKTKQRVGFWQVGRWRRKFHISQAEVLAPLEVGDANDAFLKIIFEIDSENPEFVRKMVPSESTPQELSNEWSYSVGFDSLKYFRQLLCPAPPLHGDRSHHQSLNS
jgi:hypothetical protein